MSISNSNRMKKAGKSNNASLIAKTHGRLKVELGFEKVCENPLATIFYVKIAWYLFSFLGRSKVPKIVAHY